MAEKMVNNFITYWRMLKCVTVEIGPQIKDIESCYGHVQLLNRLPKNCPTPVL
jgi:hypothetical protein